MPHIIVEHTRDIENVSQLLRDLHNSLGHQETVQIESLKTRSICLDNVVIGNGNFISMIHVTLRLLPGRGETLLCKMTADLEKIVHQYCDTKSTCVTVEAVELHQSSYRN